MKKSRAFCLVASVAALLGAAVPASATIVVYSFLDAPTVSFTVTSAIVTAPETLPSDFCSVAALCSSVTFTPTATYDEVTLLNGDNFFFAPTAFSTVSANFEQASPASANPNAQFSTLIAFSGTPEPSAWALLIGGFGMAGGVLRFNRRRGSPSGVAA